MEAILTQKKSLETRSEASNTKSLTKSSTADKLLPIAATWSTVKTLKWK